MTAYSLLDCLFDGHLYPEHELSERVMSFLLNCIATVLSQPATAVHNKCLELKNKKNDMPLLTRKYKDLWQKVNVQNSATEKTL